MIAAALLACAPNVAPMTLDAIVRTESAGDPLALHVNTLSVQPPPASTVQEAAATARKFIALGYTVDLGLTQINSTNLLFLGYTIEDAFDPCRNIAGGGAILTTFYGDAVATFGEGQPALMAAISAYNTGTFWRGFQNGYVARVTKIPRLRVAAITAPPSPYTASTLAYSREDLHVRID